MRKFFVLGDDDALAACIKPRPASATEDLLNVKDAQVPEPTFRRIVQCRALDHYGVRRQVDAPREGGSAAQNFHHARRKQTLHQCPVRSKHARVVAAEPAVEELLQLVVPAPLHLLLPGGEVRVVLGGEQLEPALRLVVGSDFTELFCRLDRVLAAVHEDHSLLTAPQRGCALIVRDLRHQHLPFHRVTLGHAHEHLRQRDRPEALIKDKEAGVRDAEELGDVRGVR